MERSNAGQPEDKANDFKDSASAQDTYFVIEIIMILLKIVRCSLIMVILMVMCQDRINHISVTTKTFVEFEQSFS